MHQESSIAQTHTQNTHTHHQTQPSLPTTTHTQFDQLKLRSFRFTD
jgi:hypothetical protein